MIRLFKQIKLSLIGQTRKYLFYTLGEIFLVMIGILLALQVNNWNEAKKAAAYERYMLKELLVSLESDQRRVSQLLEDRVERKEDGIQEILNLLHETENPDQQNLGQAYMKMKTTLTFSFDKGPYESLKSSGLDKIKNDSLRSHIVNMYEVIFPRAKDFIDGDDPIEDARRMELEASVIKFQYNQSNDSNWILRPFIDHNSLLRNRSFQEMIYLEMRTAYNYRYRLEFLLEVTGNLVLKLEAELKE